MTWERYHPVLSRFTRPPHRYLGTGQYLDFPGHCHYLVRRSHPLGQWYYFAGKTLTQAGAMSLYNNRISNAELIPKPLPVVLTGFEATQQETRARLRWATATKKDNAYFAVGSGTTLALDETNELAKACTPCSCNRVRNDTCCGSCGSSPRPLLSPKNDLAPAVKSPGLSSCGPNSGPVPPPQASCKPTPRKGHERGTSSRPKRYPIASRCYQSLA